MNPLHYQKATQVTLSNRYFSNKVDAGQLLDTLGDLRDVIVKLDGIKKALFYGKDLPEVMDKADVDAHGHIQIHTLHNDPDVGVTILHAILGLATEAGEQCELLEDVLRGHKPFDAVNYLEESGDATWYISNGLKALGFTFEQCFQTNIDKLQGTPDKPGRFRGQFDEFYAINRNLPRERATLEAGAGRRDWKADYNTALIVDAERIAAKRQKPLVLLTNWVPMKGYPEGNNFMMGTVFGHPRIADGRDVTTTKVLMGFIGASIGDCVETKNTIYFLGQQNIS